MNTDAARRLAFHGAIVLLAGLLAGMPYGMAIVEQWGEAAIKAWKLAHQEGLQNGILMLVFAALLFNIHLGERSMKCLLWGLLICGYGNAIGSVLAAITGYTGLSPGGPLLNWLVFIPFNAAVVGILIAVPAFLIGSYKTQSK